VQNDLDVAKKILTQKEKKLETKEKNSKIIGKNLHGANQDITELKEHLKGNMSLLQAKKLVWDEIIEEMKNHLEYITLTNEHRIFIKDYEGFILLAKEEGENNSKIAKRFI